MIVWAITSSAHYYNNVRVNDTPIRCLAQDESNLIWLGTGNGLYCYDGYRSVPRFSLAEIMHKTIYCMLSSGHHLYVGTSEGLIKKAKTKNFEDAFVSIATGGELK